MVTGEEIGRGEVMGRRGRNKPLPDTVQRAFAFAEDAGGEKAQGTAESWGFVNDDPREIFVGEERLETYLKKNGLGWVVKLRAVLEEVNYEAMMSRYGVLGRRALSLIHI